MLTHFANNRRSTLPDDTVGTARRIGVLRGSRTFQDSVGVGDRLDYYSFKLNQRSSFNLALNRLQNNVDVSLIRGGRVIARSTRGGRRVEAINTNLDTGTYVIRVEQKSGNSRYQLTLNGTPRINSTSRKLVSLYRPASAPVARYGLIDLGTGRVTELPLGNSLNQLTLVDMASSGGNTFAIDLLSNLYRVDPTTGNSTRIGDLGGFTSNTSFLSLGFAAGGTLYTVGTNRTTRQSALYTVNVATGGTVSLVANLPGLVDVGDIAYDTTTGRFFASASTASSSSSQLYSISLTGNTQLIGNIGFSGVGALLVDNGILYGYDSVFAIQQQQLVINTTTGAGRVDKLVTLNGRPFNTISGGA